MVSAPDSVTDGFGLCSCAAARQLRPHSLLTSPLREVTCVSTTRPPSAMMNACRSAHVHACSGGGSVCSWRRVCTIIRLHILFTESLTLTVATWGYTHSVLRCGKVQKAVPTNSHLRCGHLINHVHCTPTPAKRSLILAISKHLSSCNGGTTMGFQVVLREVPLARLSLRS